jgi:cysteine-rich repeat protein
MIYLIELLVILGSASLGPAACRNLSASEDSQDSLGRLSSDTDLNEDSSPIDTMKLLDSDSAQPDDTSLESQAVCADTMYRLCCINDTAVYCDKLKSIDASLCETYGCCDSSDPEAPTTEQCEAADVVCPPVCGDGRLDPNEYCDDGNTDSGDGCDDQCRPESIYPCYTTDGGPCVTVLICGNGVLEGTEMCDDADVESGDGCSVDCRVEPGYVCPVPGAPCIPMEECGSDCPEPIECGDGIVGPYEQCDDGVNDGGYGECAPGCVLGSRCGNGIIDTDISPATDLPYEQCDDGINDNRYGECAPGCLLGPRCGDGVIQLGFETCDDGEANGKYGGCNSTCRDILRCGDGIVQSGYEICDDGNDVQNDFCDNECHCSAVPE